MKLLGRIFSVLSLILILGCAGTSGFSNLAHQADQGIEAGNPDLGGKKITILPQGEDDIYVLQFQEAPTVRVTEINGGNYQSLFSSFTEIEEDYLIPAQFLGEDPLLFLLEFNELNEVVDVIFTDGNKTMAATFLEEDSTSPCNSGQVNAADQIAEALCSRIVACNETFICGDCISEVMVVTGLGQRFGGFATLDETQQKIQNGEIVVDPANLQGCMDDINIIPCPLVEESFNDETPPNYNGVKALIPSPSCDKGVLKSN